MAKALCFLIVVAFALQVHGIDSREDETEALKFECAKDGLYPNPRNCSTFIQCSNGIPHLMNCSTDLHFSNKSKRCEGVCDAHCDLTLACKCDWKSCGNEICFLPPKTGPCRASIPRYYFDKRDGQCKRFIYGRCNGNQNNFITKEDCEKRCGNVLDICKLPKLRGPCKGAFPRYYFNSKTGECEKFIYGGCQGNANNFETKEQCDRKCLKKLEEEEVDGEVFKCPKDGLYPNRRNCSSFIQCTNGRPIVMPCPAGLHFSIRAKKCESPCDAHCDRTLACKCEWKTCGTNLTCHLPPKTGPCRAHIPRYYFNTRTGVCMPFIYGGCEGNENNFETKESCDKYCGRSMDICKLPRVKGPCKALIPRWWYNAETKKCEKFEYGGCRGNANNFETQEQCERRCEKKPEVEGLVDSDFDCEKDGRKQIKYNCGAYIQCTGGRAVVMPCPPGLHFRVETQRCEKPCDAHCDRTLACQCNWTTCGGNTCLLPSQTGLCRVPSTRYYYDMSSGICKPFVYDGCLGNENNFRSKAECDKYCRHVTNVCTFSPAVGHCKAHNERYFFNKRTGKCQKFIYGGCGGNANNFPTANECELRCLRKSGESEEVVTDESVEDSTGIFEDVTSESIVDVSEQLDKKRPDCESPPEKGKCPGSFVRWNYNKKEDKCIKFIYGGCGGNGNNYKTEEECLKQCSKRSEGDSSEEIERSESESLECPEPNGDFPYHRDCKKFIRCRGGKPELKDCPRGKEFDFILKKCFPAGEAACAR